MNRFDKPVQYDYSFDRYMPQFTLPNFQLLAGALEGQEQKQAELEMLATKAPKYIEEGEVSEKDNQGNLVTKKYGDTEAYKQVMAETNQIMKDMETAHLTGDMAKINAVRNEGMRKLKNLWGPMGAATILEERYKGFTEGLKKLKEYEEKATDGGKWAATNKAYATLQFYKNVGVYKIDDSGYKGVIEPSVFPYIDIQEEALKYMKQIGYKDIEIETMPGKDGWQFKTRTRQVTDEALKGLNEHLRSQNFQQQYEIERHGVFQRTDFSDIEGGLKEHNEKVKAVNVQFDETKNLAEQLENGEKSKDEVKKLQQNLKAFGLYNGSIDGDYGPKTAEAAKKFRSFTKEEMGVQELTPAQYVQKGIENKYRTVAYGTIDFLKSDVLSAPYLLYLKNGYDVSLAKLQQQIVKEVNSPSASLGQDVPMDYGKVQQDSQAANANKQTASDILLKSTQAYFWDKGGKEKVTEQNMEDFYKATIDIYNANPNITAEQLKGMLWNKGEYNVNNAQGLLDDLKDKRYQGNYEEYQNAKIRAANFEGRMVETADNVIKNLESAFFVPAASEEYGSDVEMDDAQIDPQLEITVDGKPYFVTKPTVERILKANQLSPQDLKIKAAILEKEKNIPADKKQGGYRKAVQYNPAKGEQTESYLGTIENKIRNEALQTAVTAVRNDLAKPYASNQIELDNERIGKPTILGSTTGIEIPLVNKSGTGVAKDAVIVDLKDVLPAPERRFLAEFMVLDCFDEQGNIKHGAGGSALHTGGIFAFIESLGERRNMITNEGAESMMKKRKEGDPALPIITWQHVKNGEEYSFQISGKKDQGGKTYYMLQKDDNFGAGQPSWQTIDMFSDVESAEASWGVWSVEPMYYEMVKRTNKTGSEKFKFYKK